MRVSTFVSLGSELPSTLIVLVVSGIFPFTFSTPDTLVVVASSEDEASLFPLQATNAMHIKPINNLFMVMWTGEL